jgi:glutamine amidotransferase
MCRLAAYVGQPLAVARLIREPAHSLYEQSFQPRMMETAILNADGYGFGWYDEDPEPGLYVCDLPIWNDPNLDTLGPRIKGRCLLAAIRSATPTIPHGMANTQPFCRDHLIFTHNGYLDHFRDKWVVPLRANISAEAQSRMRGNTDSEHIFALIDTHWRRGKSVGDALHEALKKIAELCRELDEKALVNLMVTDGQTLYATRLTLHGGKAPTLFISEAGQAFPDGIAIASEPMTDDGDWRAVESGTLVTVTLQGHVVESVEESALSF